MQKMTMMAVPAVTLVACALSVSAAGKKSVETAARGAYVAAINSNNTDVLMADLTDDIVYQAPAEPEIVGKDAVRHWIADYFGAYRTRRKKTSIAFTVVGDWALERYSYKSMDVDKETGVVTADRGKGVNIFRRGPDGNWKVAVDSWSSDIPASK